MNPGTLWWLVAGLLVLAELLTGTFYLLMLAVGMAAAALASHLGYGLTAQLLTAAVVGGGAVVIWHLRRPRRIDALPAGANPDVVLDVGQRVHVTHWQHDGTARVQYRGASWTARLATPPADGAPVPGDHVIRAIDGSLLMLSPLPTVPV
jgi:membrane protein implicated in regulation of membrane protease activity